MIEATGVYPVKKVTGRKVEAAYLALLNLKRALDAFREKEDAEKRLEQELQPVAGGEEE